VCANHTQNFPTTHKSWRQRLALVDQTPNKTQQPQTNTSLKGRNGLRARFYLVIRRGLTTRIMAIDVPSTISNRTNGHSSSVATHNDSEPSPYRNRNSSTTSTLTTLRHLYPPFGLFLFYILHDALQERMFRYEGFSFGFFMTLVEVVIMLVASQLPRMFRDGCGKGKIAGSNSKLLLGSTLELSVLGRIGIVGLFLALSHGLGNTALRYSPYPLKVRWGLYSVIVMSC
jgi:hypothetical protein